METKVIKSPINYNGNKTKIINRLVELFPSKISVFVDLFGGSGVVSLNTNAEHHIYNEIVPYISQILEGVKSEDSVELLIDKIQNEIRKYGLSKTNKEGFEKYRDCYNQNPNKSWIELFVLISYSFNTQFRFNSKHEYNSSFGLNKSHFSDVTEKKLRSAKDRLDKMDIIFTNKSFEDFDFSDFDKDDFVYLDPPYYGSIGNYNDGKRGFKGWNLELEEKMRELCENLDKQGVRFALSNNLAVNITLEEWAVKNGFTIVYMDLGYNNSNYQKKNKVKDIEVVIKNYK